jgi:hypothetical protein
VESRARAGTGNGTNPLKGLISSLFSHLQKSKKCEDATWLKAPKRLYYGHLRYEMAKQSHLKSVLQVALLAEFLPLPVPSLLRLHRATQTTDNEHLVFSGSEDTLARSKTSLEKHDPPAEKKLAIYPIMCFLYLGFDTRCWITDWRKEKELV